jgi:hypothetical protein
MRIRATIALLLPLACLLGCTLPTTPPASTTSPLSGNWKASLTLAVNPQVVGFVGALQFSDGSISGTLTPLFAPSPEGIVGPPPCTPPEPTAATGSIDANNNLTVSLPIGGGTATITAAIASNPETPAPGSIQIVGGTCAMSAVPMTIAEYAPVTGTYTGTMTSSTVDGDTSLVTATLTQSTIPNSSGAFSLAGTITVTVTGVCSTSFVVSSSNSSVEGNSMTVLSGPPPNLYGLSGANDPTASTISKVWLGENVVPINFCSGPYQGTLTRQ